ncbi:cytochrome P450 [Bauldia sp.]|uniref:cytochrome P450 n=1 Tax=Bauldia sp. TaxID=2575872 RepID=UPI003BA989AD
MADGTTGGLTIPDRYRPAAPVPPRGRIGLLKLWRLVRDNPIAAFPAHVYEQPVARLTNRAPGPLIVSDPAAIERICVSNAGNYIRGEFQQRRVRPLLGNGLLTAEGDAWRTGRQAANPAFTPRLLKPWLAAVRAGAAGLSDDWSREPPNQAIDIFMPFLKMSFDIISEYGFSGDFDGAHPTIHRHMEDYFRVQGKVDIPTMLKFPPAIPSLATIRSRASVKALSQIVDRVIERRRAAPRSHDEGDLLDRLLAAKPSKNAQDGFVRDNVLAIILTGHETSAAALAWAIYLLACFPWASDRLAGEVSSVAPDDLADPDTLNRLTFTRCVMDEALRLYPPAPFFSRRAVGPDEIGGERIRGGDEIIISPWVVHRHRMLWDEPDLFAPERFQNRGRRTIPRGAYIPFGAGPRVCIGQAFATYELLLMLATIGSRFRFALPEGAVVEPLARITLQPRGGLRLRIAPR